MATQNESVTAKVLKALKVTFLLILLGGSCGVVFFCFYLFVAGMDNKHIARQNREIDLLKRELKSADARLEDSEKDRRFSVNMMVKALTELVDKNEKLEKENRLLKARLEGRKMTDPKAMDDKEFEKVLDGLLKPHVRFKNSILGLMATDFLLTLTVKEPWATLIWEVDAFLVDGEKYKLWNGYKTRQGVRILMGFLIPKKAEKKDKK